MHAISRRLGHQTLKPLAPISYFKSIYPLSDHYYGVDNPRYVSTIATKGVGHLVRKGTGGRSSVSGIIATVFGATGFLGCYAVQQLGKEYETRNYSFEEVIHSMAEQLALISKEHGGIMRFIQVSCLGASSSSPSRMLRAKAAAEEAIFRELPEATILRPAVMIALKDDGTSMGKFYELGGPEVFTVHELAELMFDTICEWPCYLQVPFPVAKVLAMPRDILLKKVPFPLPSPEIFHLDQINALTTDTVLSENA